MIDKKKIVFFTGAGMSRESGLPTFRGEDGMWNEIDYEKVATLKSWYGRQRKDVKERRQGMLDFFNPLRRAILEHEPNEGHRIIAALEEDFEVTVITQNGDDYHTRAGSSNVIYLHGEALKNASSANPSLSYPIDRSNPDIHLGDKAPDGSQLRPYVIYFDEDIDSTLWRQAMKATKEADWFVVVGSTMRLHYSPLFRIHAIWLSLILRKSSFQKNVITLTHISLRKPQRVILWRCLPNMREVRSSSKTI